MSGGLKQQWGVGEPAQVGPDAQSQDLKAAFEPRMDAISEDLQSTAVNGERARHDPLASRRDELVPGYQAALAEVDPADSAKAKNSIDKLLAEAESLGKEAATFRAETEKAAAEWQARIGAYDAAVVQVEELQAWQHPREAALRSLVDGIRTYVNERAHAKAIAVLDQLLPKLQPIYEDYLRQKAAQQQYEPAHAALEPRLTQAAQPRFNKLAPLQSELAGGQSAMEASAQGREFVAALEKSVELGGRVDAYTAAVEALERDKQAYEQALTQVQPKLQAAPSPSPFNKLAPMQAELASGRQSMESAAQAEEFQQALQTANDLGTKVDSYIAAVEELKRLKQEYEQALAQVQPKLQAAPSPSPFTKLTPMQAELASGQQSMESSAQAEEFQKALQSANDLGAKVDSYVTAVEELKRHKEEYEQALAQVQPKLQAAPSPSPFTKLAPMQAELASGQQSMESSAQAEEFEQALQAVNDLGTKVDSYITAVEELKRLKQEYEQALAQVQPKLQAAPTPSPFNKLAPMQAELASCQQSMESAAQAEEFEQALQAANDLGTKVDSYVTAVEELKRLKQEYEQALAQVQPKLQAAPTPSPFNKLAPMQAELASCQQSMESAAQAEEFEQALQAANDLGTKVDSYVTAVEELKRLKQEYEQALAQVQPKLQAAPTPSPFNKLAPMQTELASCQQSMESSAQAEEFEQALQAVNELGTKVDAYVGAVEELQRLKQEYEQALAQLQPKLQAAPAPSPFTKLAPRQSELASGQQTMESAAQAEDFEQALQAANDLGTKGDSYVTAVEELKRLKQEYEQALAQVQPKLQAAPSPAPFNKLAPMQAELASGQQLMESAAQAEEFEQALQAANDLGTKVDTYITAVEELKRLKQEYEQALAQVQPKLQAAPSPSPFTKLAPTQAELASGQQSMESSAQAEEFEQALQAANELETKVDAYAAAIEELQRLKQEYEQVRVRVQPKQQAAPSPSPFTKLASMQAGLASSQQTMESAAQAEDFEQALQAANDLETKVDAYASEVAALTESKQQYEQALTPLQPKLEALPASAPVAALAQAQADIASARQQMESAAQAEDFEQALRSANDVGAKADAYAAAIVEHEKLKSAYEGSLAQLQPRLDEALREQDGKATSDQQAISAQQGRMKSQAESGDYQQAQETLADLSKQVDAQLSRASKDGPSDGQQTALGTLKVNYARMSAASEKFEGNLFEIDYGLTNEGDDPASGWWLDRIVFNPDGKEISNQGRMVDPVAGKKSVDWAWSESSMQLGIGRHRVHVRFHDSKTTLFEEDLFFETTRPPEVETKGTIKVRYARMSAASEKFEGNLFEIDYGLTNEGDDPASGWWLDRIVFNPDGKEISNQGRMLDPVAGKKSVDWAWSESSMQLGIGRHRVHVRFHDSKTTLFEEDLFFETTARPEVETKGTIKVRYARMSAASEKFEGNLFQIDYGLTNEGDDPATGWWLDRVVFNPDGKEISNQGRMLDPVAGKKSVDWAWSESSMQLGIGRHRVHVRFHDRKTTIYEDDLFFETTRPPEVETKGALKVRYARMSSASETVQMSGLIQVDYGLTNEGDDPASGWWLDRVVFNPDGKEISNQGRMLDTVAGKKSVDRSWSDSNVPFGIGRHRVHVRFHDRKTTLFEEDLFFEAVRIVSGKAEAPVVTGVSPAKCPAGGSTPVKITGTGFTTAIAVHFNELRARFVIDSDKQITATTPDTTDHYSAGSDLVVVVTTPVGKSSSAPGQPHVRFEAAAADHDGPATISNVRSDTTPAAERPNTPPMVDEVNPDQCPMAGGTRVTIVGSGFSGAVAVAFGGLSAPFNVDSDTRITATTPDSTSRYPPGSELQVVVSSAAGSSPTGPATPRVTFGERGARGDAPKGPKQAEPELPSADDQRKDIEHLSTEGDEARKKEGGEAYTKALGKVAEAAVKAALESSQAEQFEAALDKLPAVVKVVVPVAMLAAATAGLAAKHGEFPVSESPEIPLPIPGSLKVTAKVTWKGPVDKPTEVGLTVSLESKEKKPPAGDRDAIARQIQLLKDDLRRWQPKMRVKNEPPKISGDPAPPLPKGPPAPVLIANFDVSKGPGNQAMNLDRIAKDVAKRSDGKTGRLQVVAYFEEVSAGAPEDSARQSQDNEDRARKNATDTANALGQSLSPFDGRIDRAVQRKGSGRTFGLSGADAAALGTHEVAVILVP